MRHFPRIALILAAAAVSHAALAAPDAKASIAGIYARLDSLSRQKDVTALTKLFKSLTTSDFKYKTTKGQTYGGAQMIAQMKQEMTLVGRISRFKSHIDSFKAKGDQATAVVTTDSAMTMSEGGKTHQLTSLDKSEDLWVWQGGAWKLKASRAISSKMTVDGKPLPNL